MSTENKTTKTTESGRKITTEKIENPYKKKDSTAKSGKDISGKTTTVKKVDNSNNKRRGGYDTSVFDAQIAMHHSNSDKKSSNKSKKPILNKKNKKRKAPSTILTVILAAIATVVLVYFVVCLSSPIVFHDFYQSSEKSVEIPGMDEGFIPQGLAYSEDADVYLICGYMAEKGASRIYVVTPEGNSKEIRLKNVDGTVYTGHAGGISCSGNNVYISNAGKIFHIPLHALLEAQNCQSVQFDGHFTVPCRASFTYCDDKMLYVGEFHHDGYETSDNNIVDLGNGKKNYAMVFAYNLHEDGQYGVYDTEMPKMVFSVRDKVQGFAVTDDNKIALSCSYGLDNSYLYFYNMPKPVKYVYNEKEILMYVLDDTCLENEVKMPFMSEDLDIENGSLIINFESGAMKYGAGLLPFSVKNVMKYKLDG